MIHVCGIKRITSTRIPHWHQVRSYIMPAVSKESPTILFWFRQDLRLHDNPGLCAAVDAGRVLPVYILDDDNAGPHRPGAASRWWLHHSLHALNESLAGSLLALAGDPGTLLPRLLESYPITAVYWNRCYEPWRMTRDRRVKQTLTDAGVEVRSFNGSLLWEPWDVLKADGDPYRVFTPFYRKRCLTAAPPREPIAPPPAAAFVRTNAAGNSIDALELLPRTRWDRKLEAHWEIGEAGAQARLDGFLDHGLDGYADGRNFPDRACVSRLSPSLHFGELSPNTAWHAARRERDDHNVDVFCSELGWREFSHSLLYHYPELPRDNLQSRFDAFPWRDDNDDLERWQRGATGYPIVDAGHSGCAGNGGAGSGTVSSMRTWRTTARAGNGSRAAAPTPRPISGSSIPSRKARSSIRMAATREPTVPNSRRCRTALCTAHGTRPATSWPLPALNWDNTTRPRSST